MLFLVCYAISHVYILLLQFLAFISIPKSYILAIQDLQWPVVVVTILSGALSLRNEVYEILIHSTCVIYAGFVCPTGRSSSNKTSF